MRSLYWAKCACQCRPDSVALSCIIYEKRSFASSSIVVFIVVSSIVVVVAIVIAIGRICCICIGLTIVSASADPATSRAVAAHGNGCRRLCHCRGLLRSRLSAYVPVYQFDI